MNANVSSLGAEVVYASEQAVKEQLGAAVDWTRFDGQRITGTGKGVYLVWDGQLRGVPNEATYNNLFINWDNIKTDEYVINNMPEGEPLSDGAVLAKGSRRSLAFLVTNGQKHPIFERQTFEQFYFAGNKIQNVSQVIIDYVPNGNEVR